MAQQGLWHITAGLRHHFDGGELDRLVVIDPPRQAIADPHLNGCRDGCDREGDDEAEPVVAVPSPAQHAGGVYRRDETANQVGRDDHVRRHQRHRIVEDHPDWVNIDDVARGVERHALRRVHPRVCGNH